MKEIAHLLNDMLAAGVISDYALFGALAQIRYTEPVATLDADVLVGVPSAARVDLRAPLYEFCARRGYMPRGEAIQVGDWPAQFIPAFSELTVEAMANAESADFDAVPLRVVGADYLAVIALSVGRAKDHARVLALLESGSITREGIAALASRHGLTQVWKKFEARFLNE